MIESNVYIDFIQPDAPRVGGITPFLQIMNLAWTEHSRECGKRP
ncbi:hypothetical protein AAH995_21420 [Pseudomonas putida]|nr:MULTISPECIES: hypothetical protein [Pseudomonas]